MSKSKIQMIKSLAFNHLSLYLAFELCNLKFINH